MTFKQASKNLSAELKETEQNSESNKTKNADQAKNKGIQNQG